MIYNSPSKSRVHRSLRGAAMEQGITLALALPVETLIYWLGSQRLFFFLIPRWFQCIIGAEKHCFVVRASSILAYFC